MKLRRHVYVLQKVGIRDKHVISKLFFVLLYWLRWGPR